MDRSGRGEGGGAKDEAGGPWPRVPAGELAVLASYGVPPMLQRWGIEERNLELVGEKGEACG